MSSNTGIYNHNSSVRDIGKLFPEEKRLGTKASDLVSGIALTVCLDIDEAFEVLGTPAEQRVAILKFTSRGRPGAAVFELLVDCPWVRRTPGPRTITPVPPIRLARPSRVGFDLRRATVMGRCVLFSITQRAGAPEGTGRRRCRRTRRLRHIP